MPQSSAGQGLAPWRNLARSRPRHAPEAWHGGRRNRSLHRRRVWTAIGIWSQGAFSADPARAAQSAADLGIASKRSYDRWAAMAVAEAARPDAIDAVAIVTPNHLHAPPARRDPGDLRQATTVQDAAALVPLVADTGLPFILTQTSTG